MPKPTNEPAFPRNLEGMNDLLWANGIYNRQDIQWYTRFKRFGVLDPFNAPTGSKEYLFFTKPDLHLVEPNTDTLNPELSNQPYFVELIERYPDVIAQLQLSNGIGDQGPFMAILSNSVKNSLEIPEISSTVIETPQTIYGTSYNYRGWGFSSDEKVDFSLEFEDTKYLEIYNLIKAYEEYERLKHLGLVTPPNIKNDEVITGANGLKYSYNYYTKNKILHDQFSVYKFIVEDDGETIIYYAKFWGVFFKNVPRDTFSDLKVDGGLIYAVNFESAFVDDMNPTIISDFNQLVAGYKDRTKDLPIYDVNKRMINGGWADMPMIFKSTNKNNPAWLGPATMGHTYKLKWRVY